MGLRLLLSFAFEITALVVKHTPIVDRGDQVDEETQTQQSHNKTPSTGFGPFSSLPALRVGVTAPTRKTVRLTL
jgi:hypothetical protein